MTTMYRRSGILDDAPVSSGIKRYPPGRCGDKNKLDSSVLWESCRSVGHVCQFGVSWMNVVYSKNDSYIVILVLKIWSSINYARRYTYSSILPKLLTIHPCPRSLLSCMDQSC